MQDHITFHMVSKAGGTVGHYLNTWLWLIEGPTENCVLGWRQKIALSVPIVNCQVLITVNGRLSLTQLASSLYSFPQYQVSTSMREDSTVIQQQGCLATSSTLITFVTALLSSWPSQAPSTAKTPPSRSSSTTNLPFSSS